MANTTPAMEALRNAEQSHQDAVKAHDKAVSQAQDAVRREEKEHAKAVAAAEKNLADAKKAFAQPTYTFAGTKLFPDHVEDGKSSISLEEGMLVEINASGVSYTAPTTNSEIAAASAAATVIASDDAMEGADVAGKRNTVDVNGTTHDSRNLFITLRTSNNAMTITCDPDKEKEARDFVDKVARAAADVTVVVERHEQEIQSLQDAIEQQRANTELIDVAKQKLQEAEQDTATIEATAKAFDVVKAATPQEDIHAYEEDKRRRKFRLILGIIIAVIIVAAVIAGFFFFS